MALSVTLELDYDVLTENDTWTSAERIEIPEDQSVDWDISVVAYRPSDGAMAHWRRAGRARRNGSGNLDIVGGLINIVDPPHKDLAALLWDTRVVVDNSVFLQFEVKGSASADVQWALHGFCRGTATDV